ncbi:hypothetical protein TNCV_4414821 [Trichonephila clavipes]|uniref:Uncharacterized protein n=1 Tax=Trichonephila clavipes TaxID=2585209 RepID=A0A8X6S049_TRICX|nr:hypothetical protein TNCV_4414821 [Trichonephila clavipes]
MQHENPPTWAGGEPATLVTEGQRQINYATQLDKDSRDASQGLRKRNYETLKDGELEAAEPRVFQINFVQQLFHSE